MSDLVRCSCGAEVPWYRYYHGTDSCEHCHERKYPKKPSAGGHTLTGRVALGDIEDVYAYATHYVARRMPQGMNRGRLDGDDVIAEAVAILFDLHANKWDPAQCPKFSTYASTLLWQRLIDWWRAEMRRQSGYNKFDGSYENVTSLDALTADELRPAEGRGRKKGIHRDREAA